MNLVRKLLILSGLYKHAEVFIAQHLTCHLLFDFSGRKQEKTGGDSNLSVHIAHF